MAGRLEDRRFTAAFAEREVQGLADRAREARTLLLQKLNR